MSRPWSQIDEEDDDADDLTKYEQFASTNEDDEFDEDPPSTSSSSDDTEYTISVRMLIVNHPTRPTKMWMIRRKAEDGQRAPLATLGIHLNEVAGVGGESISHFPMWKWTSSHKPEDSRYSGPTLESMLHGLMQSHLRRREMMGTLARIHLLRNLPYIKTTSLDERSECYTFVGWTEERMLMEPSTSPPPPLVSPKDSSTTGLVSFPRKPLITSASSMTSLVWIPFPAVFDDKDQVHTLIRLSLGVLRGETLTAQKSGLPFVMEECQRRLKSYKWLPLDMVCRSAVEGRTTAYLRNLRNEIAALFYPNNPTFEETTKKSDLTLASVLRAIPEAQVFDICLVAYWEEWQLFYDGTALWTTLETKEKRLFGSLAGLQEAERVHVAVEAERELLHEQVERKRLQTVESLRQQKLAEDRKQAPAQRVLREERRRLNEERIRKELLEDTPASEKKDDGEGEDYATRFLGQMETLVFSCLRDKWERLLLTTGKILNMSGDDEGMFLFHPDKPVVEGYTDITLNVKTLRAMGMVFSVHESHRREDGSYSRVYTRGIDIHHVKPGIPLMVPNVVVSVVGGTPVGKRTLDTNWRRDQELDRKTQEWVDTHKRVYRCSVNWWKKIRAKGYIAVTLPASIHRRAEESGDTIRPELFLFPSVELTENCACVVFDSKALATVAGLELRQQDAHNARRWATYGIEMPGVPDFCLPLDHPRTRLPMYKVVLGGGGIGGICKSPYTPKPK